MIYTEARRHLLFSPTLQQTPRGPRLWPLFPSFSSSWELVNRESLQTEGKQPEESGKNYLLGLEGRKRRLSWEHQSSGKTKAPTPKWAHSRTRSLSRSVHLAGLRSGFQNPGTATTTGPACLGKGDINNNGCGSLFRCTYHQRSLSACC
jgi:hypothetical protein